MKNIKFEEFVKIMEDNDGFEHKVELATHNEYYTIKDLGNNRGSIEVHYEHPEISIERVVQEFEYYNAFHFFSKWQDEGNTSIFLSDNGEHKVNLEYLAERLAWSLRPDGVVLEVYNAKQ